LKNSEQGVIYSLARAVPLLRGVEGCVNEHIG